MKLKLPASWKVIAFTFNLICGLLLSQLLGASLSKDAYKAVSEVIQAVTMWALSFIMINVGYEFTVDMKAWRWYVADYLIAMTAAGFPWLFVAAWFQATISSMKLDQAFLVARFAAPTSAGILFSMLEAAGLKETWVFEKARVLAIFDDLDTILLMIPLKIAIIGFKWELLVVVGIMTALLVLAGWKLHSLRLPYTWQWTMLYAAVASVVCKVMHYVTHHHIDMDPIHIEVLLPAFVIGCIIDTPIAREELALQQLSLERKLSTKSNVGSVSTSSASFTTVVPFSSGHTAPTWADAVAVKSQNAHLESDQCDESVGSTMEPTSPCPTVPSPDHDCPPIVVEEIDDEFLLHQVKLADVPIRECSGDFVTAKERDVSIPPPPGIPAAATKPSIEAHKILAITAAGPEPHHEDEHHNEEMEHKVQTIVSMVFMVLVGLSMPALVGKNAKDFADGMDEGVIALHVAAVTLLMILGKMFPIVCYRDEASVRARLALCLGMCPRGEVGASIIVISLELGISGPAIIISMCALVINLVMSGAFIGSVKVLLNEFDTNNDGVIDHDEWKQAEKMRGVEDNRVQAISLKAEEPPSP